MSPSSSPDWPFLFKKMVFASCCLITTLSFQSTATHQSYNNNCLQDYSSMGNCFSTSSSSSSSSSSATSVSHSFSDKIIAMSLPVDNAFRLPSHLPVWPPGGGFASGVIDLGGLLVSQVSSFTKVWATTQGGPGDTGFTFFEPSSVPNGFYVLGSYAQPNNVPLSGRVLVGKDVSGGALRTPTDYTLVWHVEGTPQSPFPCYVWLPVCTQGYEPVGYLVTTTPEKPSADAIRCVRSELTDVSEANAWIWGGDGVNIYTSRPQVRGVEAPGMATGSFVLHSNSSSASSPSTPACLRNTNKNFSSTMPNMAQIRALMGSYSPTFHFHPDEEFFPSSVAWFFENGALLYAKGNESNPVRVDPSGENLPRGGSNDGAYWLDLPASNAGDVKKGNLRNATAYLHVKPAHGGAATDVAVWVFYPFNGAAAAKVEFLTVKLGKIGEHVGDWEHVTLRISNFDGALTDVYFSQHSGGVWVSAAQVEFQDGSNKPAVYSSKHGHAAYPKPGENVQGSGDVGIRNDTARGGSFVDTGSDFTVVAAEYLGGVVEEPPWLDYAREWGPKISYEIEKEMKKLERFLPGKMKSELEKIAREIPSEVLGEEGPVGPKWKDNWSGDERSS